MECAFSMVDVQIIEKKIPALNLRFISKAGQTVFEHNTSLLI